MLFILKIPKCFIKRYNTKIDNKTVQTDYTCAWIHSSSRHATNHSQFLSLHGRSSRRSVNLCVYISAYALGYKIGALLNLKENYDCVIAI